MTQIFEKALEVSASKSNAFFKFQSGRAKSRGNKVQSANSNKGRRRLELKDPQEEDEMMCQVPGEATVSRTYFRNSRNQIQEDLIPG